MWRLPPTARRSVRAVLAALLIVAGLAGGPSAPRAAASDGDLEVSATLAGVDLSSVDSGHPVVLEPKRSTNLDLHLRNVGNATLTVRSVRIEGRVMGLAFLSSTTRLDVTLAPGASTERTFDLFLDDVGVQARGLLPGRLVLIGPDRSVLTSEAFPIQVRGSLLSVYAVFGVVVTIGTLLILAGLYLAIWTGRLPPNRWQRACWFLPAGFGTGLTLTFTLSAFSLLAPNAQLWLPLVLGCAAVAFVLGYFWVPSGARRSAPDDESIDPADEPLRDDFTDDGDRDVEEQPDAEVEGDIEVGRRWP